MYKTRNDNTQERQYYWMKKILACLIVSFVVVACSNSTKEQTKTVDTSIIGSDNPQPAPDTTGVNKEDSLNK